MLTIHQKASNGKLSNSCTNSTQELINNTKIKSNHMYRDRDHSAHTISSRNKSQSSSSRESSEHLQKTPERRRHRADSSLSQKERPAETQKHNTTTEDSDADPSGSIPARRWIQAFSMLLEGKAARWADTTRDVQQVHMAEPCQH